MKVIVMIKANEKSEAGVMPSEKYMSLMGKYNEELVNAGIMLSGEGLHPSSKGKRVMFSGDTTTVTDGPFAETKEIIAGFWMWRVQSMKEAVEWARRIPAPPEEDRVEGEIGIVEIRQVFDAEDFGEAFTPELMEHEAGLRAQTMGLNKPRYEDGKTMIIAGMNKRYNMENRMDISSQWQQFLPQTGSIPDAVSTGTYGVSYNQDSDCSFDYLSGVEVSTVDHLPNQYDHVSIPANRHVVFTHTQHVSSITQTIDTILNQWVPDCGLKIADAPFFIHHKDEFNRLTGMGGIEIWIPIQHS
jgi:predicted transcriptional regulator YdeE